MPTPVTPNRKTRITFDVPDTELTSEAWGIRRRGGEICQRYASGQMDDTQHQNCRLTATGGWQLRPLQTEISNITEYEIGLSLIQVPDNETLLEKLATVENIAVENQYRYNDDLPGLPASGAVLPSGGPFIVKRVAAGDTWDQSISSGVPSLLGDTPQVTPLDRVGQSQDSYPENQAWFLNWGDDNSAVAYPQYTLAFYFGQYGVAFTGSGKAELYELVTYTFDGSAGWVFRKDWKYARTGQVSGTAHSCLIYPHIGPRGEKFIEFSNGQVDFAEVSSSAQGTTATSTTPGSAVYTALPDPRYAQAPPGVVTRSGFFSFDERRDLALKLQVSTVGWPSQGFLIDDPAQLPDQNPLVPVQAFGDTVTPDGTSIVATLLDAVTGDLYDSAIHTKPQARFDFFSDGTTTPTLWSYSLQRIAFIDINAPPPFTGGNLRSVSLNGYSGDPTQEIGSLVIDDVRGELLPLLNRGRASVLVEIDHDGGTTPVFFGYVNRPGAERKVKPGRVYPSPLRHKFTLPVVGSWLRLAQVVNQGLVQTIFYGASTNPADPLYGQTGGATGLVAPWKATDAIRFLLGACGLTAGQINIPDLPIRLWPGMGERADEFSVNVAGDYCSLIQRIARNFLGLYLCYDLPTGQWTLLEGTPLDAPPLYEFFTGSASDVFGSGKVDTLPGAYGSNATFIQSFHFETIPPAFSGVHVICPVPQTSAKTEQVFERFYFNYDCYPVPGASYRPDPNNPDYAPGLVVAEIIDRSLYCGPGNDADTQAAVDWTARREYDFACHAQRLAHFEAPLVFVLDPLTNQFRIPRFLDPISVNGAPYQVKACSPHFLWDGTQMASYEVIQPIAGQFIPPGMEAVSFYRSAAARHAEKSLGVTTHGQKFGNQSVPPQYEARYRDLPRNIAYQYPGQDGFGNFPFMMGYSAIGGNDFVQ